MPTQVKADFTGAIKKTQTLLNLGKASKYQATSWTAETIKELKRSAAEMQLSSKLYHGKKTSQMGRNVGQSIAGNDILWSILLGTGVGGTQKVKYALIQDEGGTTHPNVTKKMRGWAWFMYAKWKEERYKWLALTKKSKLDIKIWPSKWFTSILEKRSPILARMMRPDAVLWFAERMGAGASGKTTTGD